MGISTTQTSGVLNIGTGARLLTGSGGAINIGTGSGATANPINIGGAGTITTFANGLTTNGPITVPSATYTPISSQIGYSASINQSNNASINLPSSFSTGGTTVLRVVNLPIGIYIATVSFQLTQPTDTVNNTALPTITVSGATSYINVLRFNGPTSTLNASYRSAGVFTGGYQVTSATNSYVVQLSTLMGTITCFDSFFSYTRIA